MRAFAFGFVRVSELILILWWPDNLGITTGSARDYVLAAKALLILDFAYWGIRLAGLALSAPMEGE